MILLPLIKHNGTLLELVTAMKKYVTLLTISKIRGLAPEIGNYIMDLISKTKINATEIK